MKLCENSHPLEVVITIKLKVNIQSMIPGGRNNQAERKGSIVYGHNGQAKHNNVLIINIPKQSGKRSLKCTSAVSFNAAANRFLFHIKTTHVKITQSNIGKIKEVLAPDRRLLLPAVRLTADGICTLIVKKEFILEEQEDTLSELEQELNELLDREVLGGSGEGAIHPTSRKLETGGQDVTLAGELDNVALGSLSVVNGG